MECGDDESGSELADMMGRDDAGLLCVHETR